jgi:hypothetical protein
MHPNLAFSQVCFALAVLFCLSVFVLIIHRGWILTRLDWISAILTFGGLASSFWLTDSKRLVAEVAAKRDELFSQRAIFVAFLAFYAITAGSDTNPYNAHIRQAFALIHGHTYIDAPNYIEHAQVGPYSYQLHPMLPSLLLMPFAAISGMDTNQTSFSIVIGAIDVALTWRLLGRFRLTVNARTWLTIFFSAGTIVWYETIHGTSWGVSMVVAIAMTLLALDELFGEGRPLIVNMFAALGSLARYDLAFVWPIYMSLLFIRGRSFSELMWFILGCIVIGVVYIAFNEVRYHSLFDRGVFLFAPPGSHLFAWENVPGNFYTLFFMQPDWIARSPTSTRRSAAKLLSLPAPPLFLLCGQAFGDYRPF